MPDAVSEAADKIIALIALATLAFYGTDMLPFRPAVLLLLAIVITTILNLPYRFEDPP